MECYLDESTGKYVPDRNGNLVYNTPTGSTNTGYKGIFGVSYDNANRELAITINQNFVWDTYKTPVIGKMVSFAYTMYDNFGFYFQDCEEVYMEHVNVYVAGGMGLRADRGKKLLFKSCKLCTERRLSKNYDLHCGYYSHDWC